MNRPFTSVVLALSLVALAGHAEAGAKLRSKWHSPDAQTVSFKGKTVVAMIMHKEDIVRRSTEIMLAKMLIERGVQAIPSHQLIQDAELKDIPAAKAKVAAAGAAGVIVMRVLNTDEQIVTGPSQLYATGYTDPSYGSFWGGYYNFGWGIASHPGAVSIERIFDVETLVFDLGQDKLIWAGTARVQDPDTAAQIIEDVMKAAVSEMKKVKILR